MSSHRTYFQDALQEVPQLLQVCSASGKRRRNLRLVCRALRSSALDSVQSYRANLPRKPSDTEPLQDVAMLLQHTRLRHLQVDLIVPSMYQRGEYRHGSYLI